MRGGSTLGRIDRLPGQRHPNGAGIGHSGLVHSSTTHDGSADFGLDSRQPAAGPPICQ